MNTESYDVLTVTLNPAIDRTLSISNFSAGTVNRVEQDHSTPGGKGVNVATALADYGSRVAVTGFLGKDNPEIFESHFAAKNIADHFVRIAGSTRTGIKITDPVQHETTDINFSGAAPTEADLEAFMGKLEGLYAPWCVLAGSVPPGVNMTIYSELVRLLCERGMKILVDTSGEPLRKAVGAGPEIVKPNVHELEGLLGRTLDDAAAIKDAAKEIVGRGVGLVVVSMGKEGALFVTVNECVVARSPDVEVRSTVGAGDAMVAGILAAQLHGLSLVDTAALASAFSFDVLTRIGPGLSSRQAIAETTRKISVTNT